MNQQPTIPVTYQGQLQQRVQELIPDLSRDERMNLFIAMSESDLQTMVAFIIVTHPDVFDAGLVANRHMLDRLVAGMKDGAR